MTDTVITVQGRFSSYYPAERATLSLSVHLEGDSRAEVFAATNDSAETIRDRITGAFDQAAGPITWWSSDNVQVWSEKPFNQDGRQLSPVYHSRVGFSVKFSDFVHLARFVEDVAAVAGVTVDQIDWALTETSKSAVITEVRSRAVTDAVAKASVYAQSIGLGHLRAIALADEGMLNDRSGGTSSSQSMHLMRVGSTASSSGPELSLKPEDIEIEAVVDARFLAT